MAKKDLSKILTTGSAKQRAILLTEELARGKYFEDKLLTASEMDMLYNSFKKPNEIKIWNEFRRLDEIISNAINNLQGMKFEVLMNYSNLRGYILVWNSIENAELLVNSVLHEIKDPKERRRIAENAATGIDLLFSKTETDQEGYIEIKVDYEGERNSYKDENGKISRKNKPRKIKVTTLWHIMNNVKKEVETSLVRYLSWERATLDFMEERGFNIKAYKSRIIEMTEVIHRPIIGWAKYSGEIDPGIDHTRLDEIIKKYAICPNVGEIKVDEVKYNWFRRYFLDGEDYPEELRGKVNKSRSYE